MGYENVVLQLTDYYPFGMVMPGRSYTQENQYRYGFNGKELDPEGMGGGLSTYDYGFRIYNPAIAKFLSVDPLTASYPWYTPYQFAGNKPIWKIDLDGLEESDTDNPFEDPTFVAAAITVNTAWGVYEAVGDALLWIVECFTTDEYIGQIIRKQLSIQGVAFDASINDEMLEDMFELKKEGRGVRVQFSDGFWASAADLGLGIATLLSIACPGASPQTLFAKTGFKLAASSSSRFLISRKGLCYGLGSKDGNRLSHIIAHTMNTTDPAKGYHGVFTIPNVFDTLDEVYEIIAGIKWTKQLKQVGDTETIGDMKRTLTEVQLPDGTIERRIEYVYNTHDNIGYEGGSKGSGQVLESIKLVIKEGTDEVITAFPTK